MKVNIYKSVNRNPSENAVYEFVEWFLRWMEIGHATYIILEKSCCYEYTMNGNHHKEIYIYPVNY